jgi:GNAT superfamily N-acetyltransferase
MNYPIKKSVKPAKAIKLEVKDGAKAAGRAYLYLIKNDLHKQPYGLMEDVFVDEILRGQGIGSKLIFEVIKEAKKHKCYKLLATSRVNRPKVHKLYSRFGFKKHGLEFRMDF